MNGTEIVVDQGRAVEADAGAIMAVISRAASDPSTDVAKLERLTALYERIKAGEAKAAYMAALAVMQPNLPVIGKRGNITIGSGKAQKYALWEDINEAIKPFLRDNGFTLSFRTGTAADGKITVTGILGHRGGHQEETTITLPHDSSGSKNAVQAVGSSTSYGKRYTAAALLNLTFTDEDDDGKATESIDATQIAQLQRAIMDGDVNLPAFLKYFQIAQLADLPRGRLEDAKAAIAAKAARAKKASAA